MKKYLSLLCLSVALANTVHAKPPNVVLILSDDQSYTDYGFMGHRHIETPHLDKLASESALFRLDNGHSDYIEGVLEVVERSGEFSDFYYVWKTHSSEKCFVFPGLGPRRSWKRPKKS